MTSMTDSPMQIPAPGQRKNDPARSAREVRNLNAAQLAAAQDFSFRLADSDNDTGLTAKLASAHLDLMGSAMEMTHDVLGSPAEWHRNAMKRWQDSNWSRHSLAVGRLAPALWNAGAAIAPVAGAGLAMMAGLSPILILGAALLPALSVLVLLPRPVDVGVPHLETCDIEQLYGYVVEAVFADLLEDRGKIEPEQAAALRRGHEHLVFIGNTTHAMSLRPFDPATADLDPIRHAA